MNLNSILRAGLNIIFLTEKDRFFLIDKAHFADVAGSYIEKMQRSIAEKDAFVGRTIIFKHALNKIVI